MGHKRKTERKIHDSHDCAEDTRIGNAAVSAERHDKRCFLVSRAGWQQQPNDENIFLLVPFVRHRNSDGDGDGFCVRAYSKKEDNDYYGRNIFLSFYYIGFFLLLSNEQNASTSFSDNMRQLQMRPFRMQHSATLRTGSRERRDSTPRNMHEHAENATSRKNAMMSHHLHMWKACGCIVRANE